MAGKSGSALQSLPPFRALLRVLPVLRVVPLLSLLFFLPLPTRAQSIHDRLAAAKTLACTFTSSTVTTWKNGSPQTELKPSTLTLRFEGVNTDEGTARVVGMFGPNDIIVRLSENTLHLIQSFREGPLYATTVFPKETRAGRFQAVHSRHEWTDVSLPGYTSSPEQYFGDCEVSP